MTELQQIDFAYLLKEYYPLSQQLKDKTVEGYLDWIVDLITKDLACGESAQGQDKRFLGALQMANSLALVPLEIYLPLYNWSFKLNLFLKGKSL